MTIRSKRDLEVELSKLKGLEEPSWRLEQYPTPSHIAAEWVWNMAMMGEVAGRTILDAGCGNGILGIGLLLLGARKVYFLDKDENGMKVCMENVRKIKEEYEIAEVQFIISDISLFDGEVDIVVQNPPFGTKEEHADKRFLQKAFSVAPMVYSMHKLTTKAFVEAISRDFGFKITHFWQYEFPIKAAFEFHRKPVRKVEVGVWRMEKVNL